MDRGSNSSSLKWETTATDVAYTCPGFEVIEDSVRLPDNTETTFHYVSEPPSVVILPFTTEDEIVAINEWRQPVNRVNFGLPAGGMESSDSDYIETAHRELTEETGYEAAAVELLGTFEPSNGIFDSTFHYVVATGCEPTGMRKLDHNESIQVTKTTFQTLLQKVLTGEVQDGRSALGILLYAQQNSVV